ncbi:MAG: type II toxin-antitoxin system Phd/YefM family antitoxin [Leptolyngbyaceae cyanobacterium RU_5_1]|nr:type II toxin-antitoxin system Phd/YefM family antitoxin [Leptolyngbyaceae cyanobacterium RU_5_1]
MTPIEAGQAQEQFSELIRRVGEQQERIVIEHRGQMVAAVISYADLKRLEAIEDARDAAALRQAMAEAKEEGFVTLEEVVEGYNALHGTTITLDELKSDG